MLRPGAVERPIFQTGRDLANLLRFCISPGDADYVSTCATSEKAPHVHHPFPK